jgi:hypothetical protein
MILLRSRAIWGIVILSGILIAGLYSCASTGQLTGGPKDTAAPKMDSLRSAQARATSVFPKELTFYFDEYIEVKDPIKQVLISPPLTYIPKVKAKGKRLTVTLDDKEVLKSNTTYTINFGEAIVDFHEGNKYTPFRHVFSTGPVLDSLSVTGEIVDVKTNKSPENVSIFLYDVLTDSIVSMAKPLYSTKPDKDGKFSFENIRADSFKIFALVDGNLNYLYDLPSESIAWQDSIIITAGDKPTPKVKLISSIPIPRYKINNRNIKSYGRINLVMSQQARMMDISTSPSVNIAIEQSKDTLMVWYDTELDSVSVYTELDTFLIKPKGRTDYLKKSKFRMLTSNANNQMLIKDSLSIMMSHPIMSIDTSKIRLVDDIGDISAFEVVRGAHPRQLIMRYDWTEGVSYKAFLDSAAIRSMYGKTNDSIKFDLGFLAADKWADLDLSIVDLDSTSNYLLKVFRNVDTISVTQISKKSKMQIMLKDLLADRYDLEIFEDQNQNGQWDPGDYWQHRQPEKYKIIKGSKLKENWDNVLRVSWSKGELISEDEPKAPAPSLNKSSKIGVKRQ